MIKKFNYNKKIKNLTRGCEILDFFISVSFFLANPILLNLINSSRSGVILLNGLIKISST